LATDGHTPDDILLDQAFEVLIDLIERYLETEGKDETAEEPEE